MKNDKGSKPKVAKGDSKAKTKKVLKNVSSRTDGAKNKVERHKAEVIHLAEYRLKRRVA